MDWHKLDIRCRDDVTALALRTRPDAIINAAYLQSDWATTADGGMHVALAAAGAGARLVHVSSDAVFSGTAPSYDETSPPDPVSPYGAAKAAAETAVKGIAPAAVIARTSLIVGDGDSKHERFVHALAAGGTGGALFTDEVRCPVHVTDLAAALLELAAAPYAGVCHVAGADAHALMRPRELMERHISTGPLIGKSPSQRLRSICPQRRFDRVSDPTDRNSPHAERRRKTNPASSQRPHAKSQKRYRHSRLAERSGHGLRVTVYRFQNRFWRLSRA